MADDEALEATHDQVAGSFDATKKKKKKKVRAPDEVTSTAEASNTVEADNVTEKLATLTVSDATAADSDFSGLKKKKKKKKPVEGELVEEEAAEKEAINEEDNLEEEEAEESGAASLTLKKKKKKKKDRSLEDELPVEEEAPEDEDDLDQAAEDDFGVDEEAEAIDLTPKLPWEGSDRDYLYEELLDRVVNILRANNPELGGLKRRTVMRPPQVLREGTKKTVFVNLMDMCKTMHRQPEHVMAFLLAELGTSGSLDGQQRLVVKGRFAPKNFEGILRRYVNEYVMCGGCKSPDTILHKENRLFFLRCEQCGSHRSVAPIKAGFVARVGRRKAEA